MKQVKIAYRHAVVLMALALYCTAFQNPQHASKDFASYPAEERWKGPNADVRLESGPAKKFRTRLISAAKEDSNFAGHYRIVVWGCGTKCQAGALIDLRSGEVFHLPSAHQVHEEDQFIFCTSAYSDRTVDFRTDSKLLILRCGARADQNGNNTPDSYYFRWEEQRFRFLTFVAGSGKFSL